VSATDVADAGGAVDPGGFYERRGEDRFGATLHTQGPWDPSAAHGGPPSALLGRAIEQTAPRDGFHVARLTVEILGPIPVDGEMVVKADVVRPGRSVELVEAELAAGGRAVARARAWRIRGSAVPLPERGLRPPPNRPADATTIDWPGGYIASIEWRFGTGTFNQPGPATVWTRARRPLVTGEVLSPLQRVLLVADSGNGVSGELDLARYWFINPELTVHVYRLPAGEWVCLQARTAVAPDGIGLAESILFDDRGSLGRGAQALMLGPRG